MGLILCLSTVSTSGLIVQPQVATAQMLTQVTAPSSTLDCPAERQQYEIREINTTLEQAEQAVLNRRAEQSSQLLIQALRRIQAMENSSAKVDLLQRLVGSMGEGFAYTSILERLVQAVPTQHPEAALTVLSPALEVTRGLSSSYSAAKTRTFVVIANYYTQLGQPEQSSRILTEASSASDAIQGSEVKTSALSDIAAAYINAKQPDKALPILERSLQYARTIGKPNSYQQATQLERIASLYAQVGRPEQALQTIRLIEVPSYSSNALLLVVDKYSEAGQVDQALEALSSIGQPEQKALALAIMAGRLTATQPQRSGQLYAEAVATAQSVQNANSVTGDVALRYAATGGLVAAADETIQKVNDRFVQAPALGAIALLYAQAGQEDRAEARLAQAIETLATIPEEGNRNSARQRLLEQSAQRGRYDYALQVAATIQPGEEAPFDRADVLTGLADQALAEDRYDAALQITEQIPPSFASWRARLFPEIARGFVQSGQLDQALMIAQQNNPNPGFRPRTLAVIAAQLAKVGQSQQAAAMFNQATLLTNTIDDASARAEVLGAIAQAYLEVGQTDP
ncbi:MAG TPA: tetratricopeptide repeat protein, partial [Trichocoleus sp.]